MDTYTHVSMEKQVTVANKLEEYLNNAGETSTFFRHWENTF